MKSFVVMLLTFGLAKAQYQNNCKQYLSCPECLNIKPDPPGQFGSRPDCGWCHVPIEYEDGSNGARCADIKDKPWNCGDQYDTATCSPGWACDVTSNKCVMAVPGDGFGSKSTCQQYCGTPGPVDKYRCNTAKYICEKCEDGDEGCNANRGVACDNCKDPNPPGPDKKKQKCDKTDPEHPKCVDCKEGEAGCQASGQCSSQCHEKQKLYECDTKTFTCIEAKQQGNIKEACTAECGHITPQELLGTWRGLMAKAGEPNHFDMGEVDMIFGDKNLTVKYPNRTQEIYDVATTGGSNLILQKGNETIKVVHNVLAYLTHTQAAGLSTFGPGDESPDSFERGMESNHALNGIMWKCNSWGGKGTCDFSNTTPPKEGPNYAEPKDLVVLNNTVGGDDTCNQFGDCHSCIGEHAGVRCGWCLGGTLSYRGIGKTPFKCGGFSAGTPFNFTCPADFRTTDCKGYSCDRETKKCSMTNDGQFPDAESCHDVCVKDVSHAKCNQETKKCDKCDEGSDPDCNTAAFCEVTCGQPHAKCVAGTGKCTPCDPKDDKECTQLETECGAECQPQAVSLCDKDTGKCSECKDPSNPGCVPTAGCEETCKRKPKDAKYKCSWETAHPTCVEDKEGTQSKTECAQQCQEVKFAKCDFKNNTCVECEHDKDPTCLQTKDYCDVAQKEGKCKAEELNGLFRMIEVNPGYDVGEFDILFKDGKMYMQDYVSKVEAKDLGTVKSTGAAAGGGVAFEVTDWKPEPRIWDKDTLFGAYKTSDGEAQTFTFLELAFSDKAITKLDDGLKGRYFVGAGCKVKKDANGDDQVCDFTKATPAEKRSSQYAKFKFLMG